jgi:hypothetical protein
MRFAPERLLDELPCERSQKDATHNEPKFLNPAWLSKVSVDDDHGPMPKIKRIGDKADEANWP